MKILVTGGTGFIGMHFLKILAAKSHKVYCVVRNPSALDSACFVGQGFNVIMGDLTDTGTYPRLPKDIDIVVHMAAVLGAWGIAESHVLANNVTATELLLDWFGRSKGMQFVFVSTPGVQGLGHQCAPETAAYHPRALYEISKVIAEKRVINHHYRPKQFWTILRPDFVYGPGDRRRIRLYSKIKNRLWIRFGSGGNVLRPTFVEDAARAIYACIGHPGARRRVFNVGGPELITVQAYTDTIAKLLDVKIPELRVPVPVLKLAGAFFEAWAEPTGTQPFMTRSQVDFLTRDHGTDIDSIRRHIGFSPNVEFEEGMRRTLEWASKTHLL
ncbi:NAD-dependent epimerase/dehydratase family protein [Desulfococcus multivorans]|uniref:NAD-dependent epimerase/dehydratase n=1 Tax=Desulfococcus multivorans DSM 2059 TaxID=1121405 RepID=S7U396_DESML|nr:NAD(P)-dependent oxidoreductase [Desulfococcus multivorans]AQV01266.1 hypothetical protein B2D07_11140 [Desulfococcus multivorans]EPR43752.1 NAD-dependent epimerase/dehydratase [Desulfococcus multivorans DSM 2059]SJZ55185.1 Nucleoside-diphosphate-sugar epimerase [Desulfococcus multivorans DSM 2059]